MSQNKNTIPQIEANTNKYLERQSKYDLYNSIFNWRNSFSKTDIDAIFMHMKDDNMKIQRVKSSKIILVKEKIKMYKSKG